MWLPLHLEGLVRLKWNKISRSERVLHVVSCSVDLHWLSGCSYPPSWVVLRFWLVLCSHSHWLSPPPPPSPHAPSQPMLSVAYTYLMCIKSPRISKRRPLCFVYLYLQSREEQSVLVSPVMVEIHQEKNDREVDQKLWKLNNLKTKTVKTVTVSVLNIVQFLFISRACCWAERLIFSVWCLLGWLFVCLLVDRELNFRY